MTETPRDSSSAREYALSVNGDELSQYARSLRRSPTFSYPPEHPLVFVKAGGPSIQAEGDMQKLAFDWLKQERERTKCNIHIPEVYRIFKHDGGWTFLIMQFVTATPFRFLLQDEDPYWQEHTSECHDMIAQGIRTLSRMPLPSDVTIGRYSAVRTRMRHPVFKDHDALLIYLDVQELEDHFNRVGCFNSHTICAKMTIFLANKPQTPRLRP